MSTLASLLVRSLPEAEDPFGPYKAGREIGRDIRDQQTLAEVGARAMKGDYAGARDTAFGRGDLKTGMEVQQFDDKRQAAAQSREGSAFELEKKRATEAAGIFQNFIDVETDPAKKATLTQRFVTSHPAIAPRLQRMGIDVNNPMAVSSFFRAQAQGYKDPADAAKEAADLDLRKAQTAQAWASARNSGDGKGELEVNARERALRARGLDPNQEPYRTFMLTGRMPREDQQPLTATDKKAILEADEMVMVNQGVLKALDEAVKLNPQTNRGLLAGTRATIGNMLPDRMVPDFVSSPQSSRATADYENVVIGQALSQLKSLFGAAPTEGERKILLDLQGSVGQPPEVRAEILRRAREAAERRLVFNSDRAKQLRGQQYYKPQGGPQPGQPLEAPQAAPAQGGWSARRID